MLSAKAPHDNEGYNHGQDSTKYVAHSKAYPNGVGAVCTAEAGEVLQIIQHRHPEYKDPAEIHNKRQLGLT